MSQCLGGNLGLQHATNTLLPRLLETAKLLADLLLLAAALDVHDVDLAPRGGELALEGGEVGLGLPVGDEPGVLAVGVEEAEVRLAAGEVGVGGVGAGERGREGRGVGRGRERGILDLVAGEVDGGQGLLLRYAL